LKAGTGSGQTDQKVRVFNLKTMQVDLLTNTTMDFFDYVTDVQFSPDGTLLLSTKSTTGYELFLASDLKRLLLPSGIIFVQFAGKDQLRLTLSNGGVLIWNVPEASGSEIGFLAKSLKHLPPR
jgi:hypothetical protein